jgi:hypothetical protein
MATFASIIWVLTAAQRNPQTRNGDVSSAVHVSMEAVQLSHSVGVVPPSGRAEPCRAEPSRDEPSRAEPSRAEPSRAEPSRTEQFCSSKLGFLPSCPESTHARFVVAQVALGEVSLENLCFPCQFSFNQCRTIIYNSGLYIGPKVPVV